MALLAEGNRISSLTRVKGLRETAGHADQVEEVLLEQYQVNRGQLDALWTYVGHKGEKKLSRDG